MPAGHWCLVRPGWQCWLLPVRWVRVSPGSAACAQGSRPRRSPGLRCLSGCVPTSPAVGPGAPAVNSRWPGLQLCSALPSLLPAAPPAEHACGPAGGTHCSHLGNTLPAGLLASRDALQPALHLRLPEGVWRLLAAAGGGLRHRATPPVSRDSPCSEPRKGTLQMRKLLGCSSRPDQLWGDSLASKEWGSVLSRLASVPGPGQHFLAVDPRPRAMIYSRHS